MSDLSIILMHSDKLVHQFVKEALAETPIKEIRSCKKVKEAYDLYGIDQSPIIVIDTFVPETSGIDLVKSIRKMNENIAIILLARIQTKSFVIRAFRIGASDILPYPIEMDVFRSTIMHRLRNIKSQEVQFNT